MTRLPLRIFAFVLAALFGAETQAAVFIVGTGSGCTHSTISAALTAAHDSGGIATVRITRSLAYSGQALIVNATQELTIEGGYATCDQASPDTTNTVISASGSTSGHVFNIFASTSVVIHLRRLEIRDGLGAGPGISGGGIYFAGDGVLEITDSLVTNNTSAYGGGIAAYGTGTNAALKIGANTIISHNSAGLGGGVYAKDIQVSMMAAGSSILLNQAPGSNSANGYGGGLYLEADDQPLYAFIGSGAPLFGAIYGNTAQYGGGVAVKSTGSNTAELQLFATDPNLPAYVGFNSASVKGGGIYATNAKANVRAWNAVLDNNLAPNGAAAYMASSSKLYVNYAEMPAAAVACPVGTACARITNNYADGNPGSIIYGESGTTIQFGDPPETVLADARGGAMILGNTGTSVFGGSANTAIYRSVVGSNTTSQEVIKVSDKPLYLVDSTIAGNTIGSGSAIVRAANSDVTIQRSILWQPGSTSLSQSGGSLTVQTSDASENTSLGGILAAETYDPRFVDPAHNDYSLRAGSVLIDYASVYATNDRDAVGNRRNVDLPNRDFYGKRDIGALERQAVQPLVLNSDIDTDLRLWDVETSGVSTRDSTKSVSGPSGSGSVHITRTNVAESEATRGLSQCIHLPANGTYALNGWGRGTSTGPIVNPIAGDHAELYWEYRQDSNENCTQGSVFASGTLTLSSTSSWARPAQPVLIPVNQLFAPYSPTIKIYLVAREKGSVVGGGAQPNATAVNTTDAWFDGITLDYIGDTIFKDGFE
ncbi:MAG: hypothetical protein JSS33_12815 [Proteobacteria bacterium]|nr:hypothetical protein [Pseudomonadota bacterium]